MFRSKNVSDKELIKLIEEFDLKKIFWNGKIDLDLKINQLTFNLLLQELIFQDLMGSLAKKLKRMAC